MSQIDNARGNGASMQDAEQHGSSCSTPAPMACCGTRVYFFIFVKRVYQLLIVLPWFEVVFKLNRSHHCIKQDTHG